MLILTHAHSFHVCREEQLTCTIDGETATIYRYWLHIIAPRGYSALGSIVIEKFNDPIPKNVIQTETLKQYLETHNNNALDPSTNFYKQYGLRSLVCIKMDYLEANSHLIQTIAESELKNFKVFKQPGLAIDGVYKLVEMPFLIRSNYFQTLLNNKNDNNNNNDNNELNNLNFDEEMPSISMNCGFGIKHKPILENCNKLMISENIRHEMPLIISYAQHFELIWYNGNNAYDNNHSYNQTTAKCSIWKPILGENEFYLGDIACSVWEHPLRTINNKLIILKSGGSDADAFKAPLRFECIWNAPQVANTLIHNVATGVSSGFKAVPKVTKSIGKSASSLFKHSNKSKTNKNNSETPPKARKKAHSDCGPSISSTMQQNQANASGSNLIRHKPCSIWRAAAPAGYIALGNIALPIAGSLVQNNSNRPNSRSNTPSVLSIDYVPKFVCVKKEYVRKLHKLARNQKNENNNTRFRANSSVIIGNFDSFGRYRKIGGNLPVSHESDRFRSASANESVEKEKKLNNIDEHSVS